MSKRYACKTNGRYILIIILAIITNVPTQIVLSSVPPRYLSESSGISQEEVLNFLNYNFERAEQVDLLNLIFVLDAYYILGVEIPNKTRVVEYLDSRQSDEGTWLTGEFHYVPTTAEVLMFYNRSGVKPAKSLDPFFSTVDTWQEVTTHLTTYNIGNYWGALWGYVTCYVVYKGESPPWTQDFLNTARENFDSWAYDNHQRTHLIMNLFQLGKPVPRVDEVVNITLQQQALAGSWGGGEAETVFMIGALEIVWNQTTVNETLIDSAISKGLDFVQNCYTSVEYQGKRYAGFMSNPSQQIPIQRETALGLYALLNPESDVWLRWIAPHVFYKFYASPNDLNYTIALVSNSSVSGFDVNYTLTQLSLKVTGLPAKMGYCNISIPKTFMWCDSPSQWNVTVDGSPTNHLVVTENNTHTSLYVTYNFSSTLIITIKGVYIVPEFQLILSFFFTAIIVTLISVMLMKKRLRRESHTRV